MQAGLFGISDLQGGLGRSDFLARSISPAAVSPTERAPGRSGVTLDSEISKDDAHSLVNTLSRPELAHICAKWNIQDKGGKSLRNCERVLLVEMIVYHAGALSELLRLRTAQSDLGRKPAVRLNAPRGTTAGCTSAMRTYEQRRVQPHLPDNTRMEARPRSTSLPLPRRERELVATGSPNATAPNATSKKSLAWPGDTLSTVGPLNTSTSMGSKDRYRSLKRELEDTRRAREIVGYASSPSPPPPDPTREALACQRPPPLPPHSSGPAWS